MPLADGFPRLDDRRFADIVNEARARIPRYTPEWTDYNAGDPGFALIELFAWMSEMLLYRLGRVPELNYLKFLEMVGIELAPARPATAIVSFPVRAGFAADSVSVPSRTSVEAAQPDDAGPVVFETERPLTAFRSRLEAVQAFDGYAYADLTQANASLAGFLPFGPLAKPGASLMLGFSSDAPLPLAGELSLAFWPAANRPVPPPSPCGGGSVRVVAPARLVWEFWAGTEWRPLTLFSDDTLALTRSGIVLLRMPGKAEAVAAKLGRRTDANRWWMRARLDRASYESAPLLQGVRANAVRVLQARSVANEVLGGSEATPGQIFVLANAPVLDGSLRLDVDEMGTAEAWTEVADFFGSTPDDPHYVLNRTTGELRFGDGTRGRIPAANPDNPQANIIARFYRFGGGRRGNLAAGQITTAMTSLPGIDVGKLTNPVASEGGTDEESLDAAIQRAPVTLKARDRAVTAEDFELLARQAGPIARAHAMPLHHPEFPGIAVPGVVTVLVVPDTAGPAPAPSEALLRTVCAHLDQRRLLTTELYVTGPSYVDVDLRLDVIATEDADTAALTAAVEAALRRYLDPLGGGADGLGWPFGGTLFFGELYRRALLPGAARVPELAITLRGVEQPLCQDVAIPAGALVRLGQVNVAVRFDALEVPA
ncbi:putative baseplate assembly protein [Falsiroseomonas sp. E2-1-a4]|uniref:putative baseplate assembly protein n=1 Tax=Falsiroseomonas sp. E2-1-a4 TaxID=3239299 RepID=UPI003F2D6A0E